MSAISLGLSVRSPAECPDTLAWTAPGAIDGRQSAGSIQPHDFSLRAGGGADVFSGLSGRGRNAIE